MNGGARISRRTSLTKLGGLLAEAVAVGGLKAANSLSATDEESSGAGSAGVAPGL